MGDSDTIYDGYNSEISRILIRTGFKIYNVNRDTITNYTDGGAPASCKITGGLYNLYAYQVYDECLVVDPSKGSMALVENIGNMWK